MRKPTRSSRTRELVPVAPTYETNKPVIAAVQVDFVRQEIKDKLSQYTLINDCVAGSIAVKNAKTTYLPMPNPSDSSAENLARYEAYRTRALFYNVAQTTLSGFVGAVFEIDPVIRLPEVLTAVEKDADGSGVSIVQLAQKAEATVLAKGRGGLRVDYPRRDRPVTRKEQLDGTVRPTLHFYQPDKIINWRTILKDNKIILSLVVLEEDYEAYDDGFAVQRDLQYRVLRLTSNGLVQELWKRVNNSLPTAPNESYPIIGPDGLPLQEIPFTFIGAEDNSPTVDEPPMFPLCDVNIAHYRNSADYEESVYVTGQATPVVSGINKDWYETVMKGEVRFGSRAGIALPTGGKAELLQMEERTAAFEAMEHKEKQMVALGAKLVETKQVQRTATETAKDGANETSILRTVTDNVSAAFTFALEWAAIFQGLTTIKEDSQTDEDDKKALLFRLNTDLDIATVSPEQMNGAINAWQKEAISYTEMRNKLKQGGLAYLDDKIAAKEIQSMRLDTGEVDEFGNRIPAQTPVVAAGNPEA